MAAVVAMTAPAAADPAPRCELHFVHASDDVRQAIEGSVASEPVCEGTIWLRVIATDTGYYVLGTWADGRVREQAVPDEDAAGMLVASWVADASMATPAPAPIVAPSIAPPIASNELGVDARPASARSETRWASVTGMLRAGGGGGGGVRGELDLSTRGAWSIGVALSQSYSVDTVPALTYDMNDSRGVFVVARTASLGSWHLRLAAGAGMLYTKAGFVDWPMGNLRGGSMFSPVGEVSALVTRRLGGSWALTGGAIASVMSQDLIEATDAGMAVATRESELMFTGGVRYSL